MTDRRYAKDKSELPSFQDMLSVSGLEFMQRVLNGQFAGPPIAKTLNFHLTEVGDGRVVFEGEPTFDALNPLQTVHGGWYGTILDSCMACAVMTKVPKGSVYTTLEYKVNIIRPIPEGAKVSAVWDRAAFGAQHRHSHWGASRN